MHVLDHREHGARARAVAGGGAVHHREEPGVDLLLDRQQVHQRLVDPGVACSGGWSLSRPPKAFFIAPVVVV